MGKEINMNAGQVNINPSDLTDILCEKCESQTFEPVYLFKKLSAVLSPTGNANITANTLNVTGQATMVPLQIYRCADCGHINDMFLPKDVELKSE